MGIDGNCYKFSIKSNNTFLNQIGFENAIHDYLRLKIRIVCVGNLRKIYFCTPDIFNTNRFFSTKSLGI